MESTEEEALLAGIRETPDDDAPRLVYADWLEENGQAERGQYIRLQCQANQLAEGSSERDDAEDQTGKLFAAHAHDWMAEVPEILDSTITERGFWTWVTADVNIYLDFIKNHSLIPFAPTQKLQLYNPGKHFKKLLDSPELRWVTELNIENCKVTEAKARAIVKCPHLQTLKSLRIQSGELKTKGVLALLGSDGLPSLEKFSMSLGELGDDGMSKLANEPGLARLKYLDLGTSEFGSDGIAELVRSPHLHKLDTLNLTGLNYYDQYANINDMAMEALAKTRDLPNVRSLQLWDLEVQPKYWKQFAQSPLADQLKVLDLGQGGNSSEVGALFSGKFTNLETLELSVMDLTPDDIKALVKSKWIRKLKRLNLDIRGEQEAETLRQLIKSPQLGKLQELQIGWEHTATGMLDILTETKAFSKIRELTLFGNNITTQQISAFAKSKFAPKLVMLNLYNNPIGDDGFKALGTTPFADSLRELAVGSCDITSDGIDWLASSNCFPRLRKLHMFGNSLKEKGLKHILKSPVFDSLCCLSFDEEDFKSSQTARLRKKFGPRLYLLTMYDY